MVKKVPNLVSIIRIILSIILLFTKPFSNQFFFLYLGGGISDILDGYIARKYKLTSEFGALLDSIGDFIFIFVLLYLLYPYIRLNQLLTIWIAVICVIRFSSIIVALFRFHTVAFLHTYLNKATGLLLFCFPIFFVWIGMEVTGILLCCLATISGVEELIIHINAKELNRNIISIFHL
ncbi:CDP-alcohol phosphatidyltransferase family protein [Candidatus Galacturonibacter soehngenii]|uniref:Phosphatidylglycerophosphate synthase n=1 Tax=Candidatus Galacturonatibacter soehngenii TaxID=2307010 RepID=A0A7V7QNF3_9FIRM|nr:CDP-alcohol phosphatidyltransferase family protein [Candidatus Galacturonibacter soehngenii]KAB1439968.1 CDP-alcohol phosphatidyltransferase family protein [Candidatus Galacturonibacter soehngenii]